MKQNKNFSVQDFKSWITEQKHSSNFNIGIGKESPYDKHVGKSVRTKVSKKKLMEKIETESDAETLIDEFMEDGGTVVTVEERMVHIEVESGEMYLPRFCVKIVKED